MDFDKTKISHFKPISDYMGFTYRVRRCFQSCHMCRKGFDANMTNDVHMIITYRNETMFICDNCKEICTNKE